MECFGTTDFDNNSRLITLSAIIISGLHCIIFCWHLITFYFSLQISYPHSINIVTGSARGLVFATFRRYLIKFTSICSQKYVKLEIILDNVSFPFIPVINFHTHSFFRNELNVSDTFNYRFNLCNPHLHSSESQLHLHNFRRFVTRGK